MFNLGVPELIIIFLFIVLLFGAKKIPEIAKGLGKGIKGFKKEIRTTEEDVKSVDDISPNQ